MKKTALTIVALVVVLISFLLGVYLGGKSAQARLEKKDYYLSMLNNISRYSTPVEISHQIADKRYDQAKCIADLTASIYYRELQSCLAEEDCHDFIHDEVKKIAPELLIGDKSRFAYYGNMERCTFAKKE